MRNIIILPIFFLLLACAGTEATREIKQSDNPSERAKADPTDISTPAVYPQTAEVFKTRFTSLADTLLCNIKEYKECTGFTNNCNTAFRENMNRCLDEKIIVLPDLIEKHNAKTTFKGLWKCTLQQQTKRKDAVFSIDACNKINEMRKRNGK